MKTAASRLALVAGVVVVAIGLWLRITTWYRADVLWLDECYLAVNIVGRGLSGMFLPLDYSQSAPVLFMAASKVSVLLFGQTDHAFRLVALLSSMGQLVLFWLLCRRTLPVAATLLATGVLAVMPRLLYYASELKQYSTEALVATLLLYLAVRWFEEPENKRRFAWLAAAGAVLIFAAHTAVFILAVIGVAALFAPAETRRALLTPWRIAAVCALWIPLFAVNYRFVIAINYGEDVMANYWSQAYPGLPFSADGRERWKFLLNDALLYFRLNTTMVKVLVLAGAAGLAVGLWKRRPIAVLFAGPVVLYWLAGMAYKAPFGGRLLVFLVPIFVASVAVGCALLVESLKPRILRIAMTLALVFAGLVAIKFERNFDVPKRNQRGMPQALAQLDTLVQAGDTVYFGLRATPVHRIYATSKLLPPHVNVVGGNRSFEWVEEKGLEKRPRPSPVADLKQVSAFPVEPRVWYVVSGYFEREPVFAEGLEALYPGRTRLAWSLEETRIYVREPLAP